MTRFMLDTSICVELLRGRAPGVFAHLRRIGAESAGISTISLAELQYGVARSARPDSENLLSEFCAPLAILPFDSVAAETYGQVRATLERSGTPIGPMDTLIAAHALSLDLTLVTNNPREFERVADLRVENWLKRQ